MPPSTVAQFVYSHAPTAASTAALARTFPRLLSVISEIKGGPTLTEVVTAVPQIVYEDEASRTLAVHINAMTPKHVTQLLKAGESHESVLQQLLWLTVDTPALTSAILEQGNWSRTLIYTAYKMGCTILDGTTPAYKHKQSKVLVYTIMLMSAKLPTSDQIVEHLIRHKTAPQPIYANYAFSKFATSQTVFETAIKAVQRETTITLALMTLAAVPTITNRELADELLRAILEKHNVEEILEGVYGYAAILNILANPYVEKSITEKLQTSKFGITIAPGWSKLNQPELHKLLIHSPNIFNEKGRKRIRAMPLTRGFSPKAAQGVEWLTAAIDMIDASPARAALLYELFTNLTATFLTIDGTGKASVSKRANLRKMATTLPIPAATNILTRFNLPGLHQPSNKTLQLARKTWAENFLGQLSKRELENNKVVFKEAIALLGASVPLWADLYEFIERGMAPADALNVVTMHTPKAKNSY